METLTFSYNWNNKLNCDCFTTLRLHNSNKFKEGNTFKIVLKQHGQENNIGLAKVSKVYPTRLQNLSDHACMLDTGYTKEDTINIVKNMYKNMSGFCEQTTVFDLVVLKKIKQPFDECASVPKPVQQKTVMLQSCPNCQRAWNHLEIQSQHCDLCNYPDNEDNY